MEIKSNGKRFENDSTLYQMWLQNVGRMILKIFLQIIWIILKIHTWKFSTWMLLQSLFVTIWDDNVIFDIFERFEISTSVTCLLDLLFKHHVRFTVLSLSLAKNIYNISCKQTSQNAKDVKPSSLFGGGKCVWYFQEALRPHSHTPNWASTNSYMKPISAFSYTLPHNILFACN